MSAIDRARIEELLRDKTLSFRAIARDVGASDWTIRKIARDLSGDDRPMKRGVGPDDDESNGFAGWIALAGIIVLFVGALWLMVRGLPPSDESAP